MQAVVSLSTQYRMAEDIQLLANTLMYSSALRPGNAAIASAMLHLPPPPPAQPPILALPGQHHLHATSLCLWDAGTYAAACMNVLPCQITTLQGG